MTLVCELGQSRDILDWYSETCGMTRFSISPEEEEEGLVLEEVGMKLSAGTWVEEWLCREEGVSWDQELSDRNFKLVLAEPLPGHEEGHVNKFLRDNAGPGVQHIGLATLDISHTLTVLSSSGAEFRTEFQHINIVKIIMMMIMIKMTIIMKMMILTMIMTMKTLTMTMIVAMMMLTMIMTMMMMMMRTMLELTGVQEAAAHLLLAQREEGGDQESGPGH